MSKDSRRYYLLSWTADQSGFPGEMRVASEQAMTKTVAGLKTKHRYQGVRVRQIEMDTAGRESEVKGCTNEWESGGSLPAGESTPSVTTGQPTG